MTVVYYIANRDSELTLVLYPNGYKTRQEYKITKQK